MKRITFFLLVGLMFLFSCSENYSNGERIGTITKFSNIGVIWKSWEGHLNVTQTGMNTANSFDFSIDNDREPAGIVATLDSAARFGWKVKLTYHQVWGAKNCANNRGETDYFVTSVEVLDRDFDKPFSNIQSQSPKVTGKVIDTIYVVVVPKNIKEFVKWCGK